MNTTQRDITYLNPSASPETSTEKLHSYLIRYSYYRYFFSIVFRMGMLSRLRGKSLIIAIPYLWLLIFFLCPFLIVLKISVSEPAMAQPPYTKIIESLGDGVYNLKISFYNYITIITDNYYINAFLNSLKIAVISTFLTLIVAFPMAYAMAKSAKRWRNILLMLVILPFWSSFLIRVYALIAILKDQGILNDILIKLGIISKPIVILNTDIAVFIGIVYSYLPFMILPIYASLEKFNWQLVEAATDLGAKPFTIFWKIIIPISKTGIMAGCFLVFIPSIGEFIIPDLLGGDGTVMIGKVLWTEFFNNTDWTIASSIAISLLIFLVIPIIVYQKIHKNHNE